MRGCHCPRLSSPAKTIDLLINMPLPIPPSSTVKTVSETLPGLLPHRLSNESRRISAQPATRASRC